MEIASADTYTVFNDPILLLVYFLVLLVILVLVGLWDKWMSQRSQEEED